jgi:iron complex outermembrane receptor protein
MCVALLAILAPRPAWGQTASLSGSVVDASGGAIAGATVTVLSSAGVVHGKTTTDSMGRFEIQGIPQGKRRVQVEQARFKTARTDVEIVEGVATPTIRIALEVGGISESVTVEAEPSYVARNADTATKTDTPLMDTPMTVQVVPQQVLKDLGITSSGLSEALASQGVQTLGFAPSSEILVYRGFLSTTKLWNGFRIEEAFAVYGEGNGGVWMDNVERLEVLKGPSSILYGRAEPGGAVNVLTEKPQADFHGEVKTGIGSWYNRWLAADLTGSINRNKTLLYRLNAAIEGSNSYFRHGPDYRSRGIAPTLVWLISPQTTLSIEGQYRHLEGPNGVSYIPIDPSTGKPLAVDRSITFPRDIVSKFNQNRTMVGLGHRFNADWSLSWKALHDNVDNPLARYTFYRSPQFPVSLTGALTIKRNPINTKSDTSVYATVLDLTGHVRALGIKHTILLGAEYYDYYFRAESHFDFNGDPIFETDYFNPAPFPWELVPIGERYNIRRRSPAFYAQDQMALPGNWSLLLGARYQRLDESVSYVGGAKYKKNVVQPRVGLLWRPQPWISAYYSYSENMGVGNGFEFPGNPLKPESSRQHELGVKTQWLKDRMIATLAVFDLTKFNIAAGDSLHPGFNIGVGEV